MTAPADHCLLSELARVAAQADPAPALVVELGQAAFLLRRLDAELAELVADSRQDSTGVRSASSETRLLAFEAGVVAVDVQVSPDRGRFLLLGQVVRWSGGAGGVVRLEAAGGPAAESRVGQCEIDDLGGFRLDRVPAGLVRLHVTLPGAGPVTTTWVTL